MRKAAAMLVVGWILTSYTGGTGMLLLREYRSQAQCEQVAEKYNVERVWDGPQEVLGRMEGELFCSGDETATGTYRVGTWHTQEWKPLGE